VGPGPDSVDIFPAVLPKLCSDVKGQLAIQISLVFVKAVGREGIAGNYMEGESYITGSFAEDEKLLRAVCRLQLPEFHLSIDQSLNKETCGGNPLSKPPPSCPPSPLPFF